MDDLLHKIFDETGIPAETRYQTQSFNHVDMYVMTKNNETKIDLCIMS